MRVRALVVLLALVAMALAPSEAVAAESVGSVVGQVASCMTPSGLLRDAADHGHGSSCVDDLLGGTGAGTGLAATLALGMAALVALVVALTRRPQRRRHVSLAGSRWRLADAVVGTAAPWRGPPLPV